LIDLEHNGHSAVYVTEILKLMHRMCCPKPAQGTKVQFAHLDKHARACGEQIVAQRARCNKS